MTFNKVEFNFYGIVASLIFYAIDHLGTVTRKFTNCHDT